LTEAGWSTVEDMSKSFMKAFSREDLADLLSETDIQAWADDSFRIAVAHAYGGITEKSTPTKDYIETCWNLV
jgi:hypothetical protein